MKRVYLAGPIAGLTYDQAAKGWRKHVHDELAAYGIECYSPMRGKEFLKDMGARPLSTQSIDVHPMTSSRGIVRRDMNDVRTCDLMLVNLLDAPSRSIGTMVEYGWASAWGKPIVTIKIPKGCHHDHLFVDELSMYQVDNVDAAIKLVKYVLLSGH